ncbi:tyrosinase family oxidase copper chaperone [Streptomyces albus]|uniref:tyrosinase family oxidase copper chaperone n=1 Tax=Streptomyces albus TaxID=1888 RepID=UPI0010BE58FE|nr:tyrosinase family oxidase copper chaperone [Streptomyces albus]
MRRREMVKATTGLGTAMALSGAAGWVLVSAEDAPGKAAADTEAAAVPVHTETYRGRNIEITGHKGAQTVRIDGRELHLMKLGDDAYLSAMCHYGPAASPLAAARRAVEELRGAQLLPLQHGAGHSGHRGA